MNKPCAWQRQTKSNHVFLGYLGRAQRCQVWPYLKARMSFLATCSGDCRRTCAEYIALCCSLSGTCQKILLDMKIGLRQK